MNIRKIEHLGIACRDVEKVAGFYSQVLGLPIVSRETIEAMHLKVIKVRTGESVLELLEPLEGESVIRTFLDKKGEGFHHVCFEVEDVRAATGELKANGLIPIWEEPKVGAGGRRVNFLRPGQTFGVLIELNQAVE